MQSTGPIAPYAFTTTPQLSVTSNTRTPPPPMLSPSTRSTSAPILPVAPVTATQRQSMGHLNSQPLQSSTRQALTELPNRPQSTIIPNSSSANSLASSLAKPSPDRYRRVPRRQDTDSNPNRLSYQSAAPSGSGMAAVGHLYQQPTQPSSSPLLNNYSTYRGQVYNSQGQPRKISSDDITISRSQSADLASRYRRRSVGSLETAGLNHANDTQNTPSPHPNNFMQAPSGQQSHRPASAHTHTGSTESISSENSGHSSRPSVSATVEAPLTAMPLTATQSHKDSGSLTSNSATSPVSVTPVSKQEAKIINILPRTTEGSKRLTSPSPLSKPLAMSPEASSFDHSAVAKQQLQQPQQQAEALPTMQTASPAAQHLAALNVKEKKSSKLRRAFSFGSAAELRKASAHKNMETRSRADTMASRTGPAQRDEMTPEQARVAQRQEESGLGEGIYSGQGNFFTGSTDNLSISSTASSASIMLRKMGKSMKKGTKSIAGLFRPKSVIGVPAADGPVTQATTGQVTLVNIEAEREKVNVNANPHDQVGGGTGFPRLERNSIDAGTSIDNSKRISEDRRSRRSIVGGERERAEVLAAVKKGILKRTDSSQSSPTTRPFDRGGVPDFNLPQIPHVNDSPRSSAPSTPGDDQPPRSGHRRTDSITIEGLENGDYFGTVGRFDSLEAPFTPRATLVRNISFSPRLQFHETWTAIEYDRRGEIATCNRLTPMLAQQIKEELNTFKMVSRPPICITIMLTVCRKWKCTRTQRCTLISSECEGLRPMICEGARP